MNTEILDKFTKSYLKDGIPQLKSGDTVKVHQKIKEGEKERIQVFEGVIIATKHGQGVSGTFTVRKISSGIGIERIFPLHAPFIEKVEIVGRSSVRRSKLYYLRDRVGKGAKLKRTDEKAKVAPKIKK